MSRRRKPQLNIELTEPREEVLRILAERTESFSTNGTNKGQASIGAFVRRISEGHIVIYYRGKKVSVPPALFFK